MLESCGMDRKINTVVLEAGGGVEGGAASKPSFQIICISAGLVTHYLRSAFCATDSAIQWREIMLAI